MAYGKGKHNYSNRKFVVLAILVVVAFVYVFRLFYMQVVDDTGVIGAGSNAFLNQTIYPSRGLIYDRNHKLVVSNQPVYDIMVIPREVQSSQFDTVRFCEALNITVDEFNEKMEKMKDRRKNPGYSTYTPQIFETQLSTEDYGRIQELFFHFPGAYIQQRVLRDYQYKCGAHALGSIGEVTQKQLEADNYYKRGDYRGQSGIEFMYEELLRGDKGCEVLLRDVHGNIKGKYQDGAFDKAPVSGKDLTISLDIELQQYAEQLMHGKRGSIVAIEPSTGEILVLVSAPSFDPSLLVGRERSKNYVKLLNDPNRPLFDRPLMAKYPPGSTFKTVQALVMQQEGSITENTAYPCHQGYFYGGSHKLGCHNHASPLNLEQSVANSCNAYYCFALKEQLDNRLKHFGTVSDAYQSWRDKVLSFGFNSPLGVDYPNEKGGNIPSVDFYNKRFGKNHWRSSSIISISIGQGEILCTPIQIANLAAIIANKGYYYTPHILKGIDGDSIDIKYRTKHQTLVDSKYFDVVQRGMLGAVEAGTAHGGRIDSIRFCGKTGTAQNPHGKDHSIFMSFAPYEEPKIAIMVFVENGGFGATYAVPIASLIIEKYLKGYIPEKRKWIEERILNTNLIESHQ